MMYKWSLVVIPLMHSCSFNPPNIPEGVNDCEGSCIVLEHFDCPEKGASMEECVDSCIKIASVPYLWTDTNSGPSCIVIAETLADVRRCNVRCGGN